MEVNHAAPTLAKTPNSIIPQKALKRRSTIPVPDSSVAGGSHYGIIRNYSGSVDAGKNTTNIDGDRRGL